MQNIHGYSPHQLVFGKKPNLPSVLTNKPPALESTTKNECVAKHFSALHASRKAFTEAECSEKIQRALRKQLHQTHEKYEMCDGVLQQSRLLRVERTRSCRWPGWCSGVCQTWTNLH